MGMVEADALLAHEAHQVRRVALAQHLGRADLLGLRIPGAPDGPGSALGDQVYQREAPDNHVSHSRLSISVLVRGALCWPRSQRARARPGGGGPMRRGPTCLPAPCSSRAI